MNAVGVRCCLNNSSYLLIEIGFNVVDWVAIEYELLVVLESVVATSR